MHWPEVVGAYLGVFIVYTMLFLPLIGMAAGTLVQIVADIKH